MASLSTRQQMILNRVVDCHIETGQPVGSRSLTSLFQRRYRHSYSSATLRHEMGMLEDEGYLCHPHRSAGRLPTDRGYRFYIENGLQIESVDPEVLQRHAQELDDLELRDLCLNRVSEVLSQLSGEVSVVLVPLATRRGDAPSTKRYKMFVRGTGCLLEKPEFQELGKVRKMLTALEQESTVVPWLEEDEDTINRVSIVIGKENNHEAFQECSVVSSYYEFGNVEKGLVAILGPKRLRYSRVVPLVKQMGQLVGRLLEQRRQGLFDDR